jgi:hypothetical protein
MANQSDDKPKVRAPKNKEKSALEPTAEVVGSTPGTIAVSTGPVSPSVPTKSTKIGKLQKKNKKRLPRKEKKRALKKK